jgi:hypothetical protein
MNNPREAADIGNVITRRITKDNSPEKRIDSPELNPPKLLSYAASSSGTPSYSRRGSLRRNRKKSIAQNPFCERIRLLFDNALLMDENKVNELVASRIKARKQGTAIDDLKVAFRITFHEFSILKDSCVNAEKKLLEALRKAQMNVNDVLRESQINTQTLLKKTKQ